MPTITVSEEIRMNNIITALEGGSNYWYYLSDTAEEAIDRFAPEFKYSNLALSERVWQAIKNGASIPVNDAEDEGTVLGTINLASIEKGEAIMASDHLQHFADMMNESGDAFTADVWFQLCTLGEIIYG